MTAERIQCVLLGRLTARFRPDALLYHLHAPRYRRLVVEIAVLYESSVAAFAAVASPQSVASHLVPLQQRRRHRQSPAKERLPTVEPTHFA